MSNPKDREKEQVLLIYKLLNTNNELTREEKEITLHIYPNDVAAERHLKRNYEIIPSTTLICTSANIDVDKLVIKSLYEFSCRLVSIMIFNGVTIIDGNPIIEVNNTYTLLNRKYEIDIREAKVILRRNSQIILEEPKWICGNTFYNVMLSIYSKIRELKLLPMFTHIKMQGDKEEEMRQIVNKLKGIHKELYPVNNDV